MRPCNPTLRLGLTRLADILVRPLLRPRESKIGVELKRRSQQPGVPASPTRQIVEDVTQLSEMLRWWTYRRRASASDLTGSLTRQQAKVSDHRVIRKCPSARSGDELPAGHAEELSDRIHELANRTEVRGLLTF